MSTKQVYRPVARTICQQRQLSSSSRIIQRRLLSSYISTSNQCRTRSYRPLLVVGQRRTISASLRNRYADVEESFNIADIERESDEVDVCIVGAGPAGLSAAIKLKQIANEEGNEDFRVIVLEKGGEVGAHILSGNVLEPRAIDELLPNWLEDVNESRFEYATPAGADKMRFLTRNSAIPIPAPPQMHNKGNYIISLSQFTKWLG